MSNQKRGNRSKERDTEWQERVVQIRRVTKVVKGGKKLSFRAILVIGNEKGEGSVGVGKASDVIGAVKKAAADGRRNLVSVALTKDNSIPHIIQGRAGAAKVIMRPSAPGSGVIAGGSVRAVFELLGIQDIVAKSVGSSNPYNIIRAAVDRLKQQKSPKIIAARRSKKVGNITSSRETA